MNVFKHFGLLAALVFAVSAPAWCAGSAVAGVPNFHQVNEKIYRGGQPSGEAWSGLAKLGVKTVIDLRQPGEHATAEEEKAVTAAGMKYVNIPMKGVVAPSEGQVSQAMDLLLNSPEPVFIHCRRGSDRTGTIVACYRMYHDKWNNKQALSEAKSLGMSWTQFGMKGYLKSFKANTRAYTISPAPAATAEALPQN
jgi:tyrosine-protein phosphatase SIW14